MAGRYVDRYERRNGVRNIAHRSEVNDWNRTVDATDAYFRDRAAQLRGARETIEGWPVPSRGRVGVPVPIHDHLPVQDLPDSATFLQTIQVSTEEDHLGIGAARCPGPSTREIILRDPVRAAVLELGC